MPFSEIRFDGAFSFALLRQKVLFIPLRTGFGAYRSGTAERTGHVF